MATAHRYQAVRAAHIRASRRKEWVRLRPLRTSRHHPGGDAAAPRRGLSARARRLAVLARATPLCFASTSVMVGARQARRLRAARALRLAPHPGHGCNADRDRRSPAASPARSARLARRHGRHVLRLRPRPREHASPASTPSSLVVGCSPSCPARSAGPHRATRRTWPSRPGRSSSRSIMHQPVALIDAYRASARRSTGCARTCSSPPRRARQSLESSARRSRTS